MRPVHPSCALRAKASRDPLSARGERLLRDVFGSFATGVTVVTASRPDGSPFGVTVSSFTAVSLDPPLVLVCLNGSGSSGKAIASAGSFAVNILRRQQQDAAAVFSGRPGTLEPIEWSSGEHGTPVLNRSLGVLECQVETVHRGGDHDIIVGRVMHAGFEQHAEPLIYYRGQFGCPVAPRLETAS